MKRTSKRSGQSLVEILVAFGIVAIVLGAVVTGITVTLRSNLASRLSRSGSVVLQELMDRVRITAAGDWHSFYNPTDKTLPSYVVSDAGAFNFINGSEGVLEVDIVSGLVGHWKFDEAQGTDAYDSSPSSANKGTMTNDPVQAGVAACKAGGCLDFDGVDDRVSLTSFTPTTTNQLTVSAWLNPDAFTAFHTIIGQSSQANPFVWFFVRSTTNIGFQFHNGGAAQEVQASSMMSGLAGIWTHVAVVADYSAGTVTFYRNGTLFQQFTGLTMIQPNVARPLHIGSYSTASHRFDGKMDDVRIYDRTLSPAEITQMYQSRVYVRSFIAEDVQRNPGGNIITDGSAGTVDPSTQKINGTVIWEQSQLTASEYLTRSNSRVDVIDDWSDASTYSSQSNLNLSNPNEATLVD